MVYQKSKQKPKVCHASCMKQKWRKLLLWSMLHRDMKHASSMKYVHMKHASYEAFLLHAWSMLHRSHEACFIIMKHASWVLWSMLHNFEACFMVPMKHASCFIMLHSLLHHEVLHDHYAQPLTMISNYPAYPEITLWPWFHTKNQFVKDLEIKLIVYPDFKPRPWNQTMTLKSNQWKQVKL